MEIDDINTENYFSKHPLSFDIENEGSNDVRVSKCTEWVYIQPELMFEILLYLDYVNIFAFMIAVGNKKYIEKFTDYVVSYYKKDGIFDQINSYNKYELQKYHTDLVKKQELHCNKLSKMYGDIKIIYYRGGDGNHEIILNSMYWTKYDNIRFIEIKNYKCKFIL